ncbi:MAG: hypothetical protein ACK5WZ_09080 [Pseudobdellovibrionaceae bacterium]
MLLENLSILAKEVPQKDNQFIFKEVMSQFQIENLQKIDWKNLNFIHQKGRIQSQGGWNEAGELYGTIQAIDSESPGAKQKKWSIKGRREKPQFEE